MRSTANVSSPIAASPTSIAHDATSTTNTITTATEQYVHRIDLWPVAYRLHVSTNALTKLMVQQCSGTRLRCCADYATSSVKLDLRDDDDDEAGDAPADQNDQDNNNNNNNTNHNARTHLYG
eukprot:PhM_4_TR4850/c0_g1_i2/m.23463